MHISLDDTFQEFQREFPDDAACLAKVMKIQYGGDVAECQGCNRRTQFHPMTKRRAYSCQECGRHIYPCAGTIFHKSSTKLSVWFFAMHLMTSTRHGVAAKEVERQTGVTYKTAWRICHELRKLMASADYKGPLSGHVEVDETLVGGVAKGGAKRSRTNKTTVFAMVERDGKMRAGPVPDASKFTLEPIIRENVLPGTVTSSDEHGAYNDLGNGYDHGTVSHSAKDTFAAFTTRTRWKVIGRTSSAPCAALTFTSARSTLGNTSRSFPTAATCATRTAACLLF